MLKSLVSQLDLFGIPVILSFSRSRKSKSTFGGFCSLMFAAFILWSIYHFSQDLLSRKDPKILSYQSYQEDPVEMIISSETFPFAFGVQKAAALGYPHYIDDSIYKAELYFDLRERIVKEDGTVEEIWTPTLLETERCTPEHFGSLSSKFSHFPLNDLFCIKPKQPGLEAIKIKGAYESTIYETLRIMIYQCNNETSQIPCAPQETLDSILRENWFNIYYPNLAINPQNYADPDEKYIETYYTMITNNYYKDTIVTLGHVNMITDNGWLVEDNHMKNYIRMTGTKESLNVGKHPDKLLIISGIILDRLETWHTRSYTKIQVVLAQVQGLVTTSMIILVILSRHYSQIKFHESLINEMFTVNLSKEDKRSNKQKGKKRSLKQKQNENPKQTKYKEQTLSDMMTLNRYKTTETWGNQVKTLNPTLTGENQFPLERLTIGDIKTSVVRQTSSSSPKEPKIVEDGLEKDTLPITQTESPSPLSPPLSPNDKDSSNLILLHSQREQGLNSLSSSRMSNSKRNFQKTLLSDIPFNKRLVGIDRMRNNSIPSKEETLPRNVSTKPLSFQGHLSLNKDTGTKVEPKVLNKGEDDANVIVSLHSEDSVTDEKEPKREKTELEDQNEQIKLEKNTDLSNKREANDQQDYTAKKESQDGPFQKLQGHVETLNEAARDAECDNIEQMIAYLNNKPTKIEITFLEYVCSFFWKTNTLNEKRDCLKEGMKNINERLDIFNILKKLREIDKLKALLLDENQLVLFNSLPKPEIRPKGMQPNLIEQKTSHLLLKRSKFIEDSEKKDKIVKSYTELMKKPTKTEIDKKLLEVYDDFANPGGTLIFNVQQTMRGNIDFRTLLPT